MAFAPALATPRGYIETRPYGRGAPAWSATGRSGQFRLAVKAFPLYNFLANTCIFSMRWANEESAMLVRKFRVSYRVTTAFSAAQLVEAAIYHADDFTVPDSAGEAVAARPKMDTQATVSAFQAGDIRKAALIPITTGTRTLRTHPVMRVTGWSSTTVGDGSSVEYGCDFGHQKATNPWTIRHDEGIVVNLVTALGAGGRLAVYVECEWDEAPTSGI